MDKDFLSIQGAEDLEIFLQILMEANKDKQNITKIVFILCGVLIILLW